MTPGWNLSSLPKEPADSAPVQVLQAIDGAYRDVYTYDGCDPVDPWRHFDPTDPAASNLQILDHKVGFWIDTSSSVALPSDGLLPDSTIFQICQGWNLIGFPAEQSRPVRNALASIEGKYIRVFGYDPEKTSDPWLGYDVGVPSWANDLVHLEPGRGYWILATENTVLEISNSGGDLVVALESPADLDVVTSPTSMIGTVQGQLLKNWDLSYRALGDADWQIFAADVAPVSFAELGIFDPTLLANGLYEIRLRGTDYQHRSFSETIAVVVEGQMKIGHFRVAFLDMQVFVAGLPLEIIREYDSRKRNTIGDFGNGWELRMTNVDLQETDTPGLNWDGLKEGDSNTLAAFCIKSPRRKEVTITFPDDRVFRFVVRVDPECELLIPAKVATLVYEPLPGTFGTLEPVGIEEQLLVVGSFPGAIELWDQFTTSVYDPDLYRMTLLDGTSYLIHQEAGLLGLRDANGNEFTVTPNGIQPADGIGISFQRDAYGRLTSITDADGVEINYQYDGGDLAAVVDGSGTVTGSYDYDDAHYLLAIKDARGTFLDRYEYDDDGRVARHQDADGNVTEYNYDVAGNSQTITDRLGNTTTYVYDNRGNVAVETDALGGITTRVHDTNDNLLTETNPLGHVRSWTYTARNEVATETDALGNTSTFEYTSSGKIKKVTDPLGGVTEFFFDEKWNVTKVRDAVGSETQYSYAVTGALTSVENHLGCRVSYTYDDQGNLSGLTNGLGHTQSRLNNNNGNPLEITGTRTLDNGDQELLSVRLTYDTQGNVTKTVNPLNGETRTVYDGNGRPVSETDEQGRQTRIEYHDRGEISRIISPNGQISRFTYNENGQRAEVDAGLGRVVRFEYDKLGRAVGRIFSDETRVETVYDAAGRIVAVIDERGGVREIVRDANGNKISEKDAAGNVSNYSYDANGNLLSQTDANGDVITFEYDAKGRQIKSNFPDGTSSETRFDAVGRISAKKNREGREKLFHYDCENRLIAVDDFAGNTTSYTYDEQGNLVRIQDAEGRSTHLTYDSLGRPTSRTLPMGQVEHFFYNETNLVSSTDFKGNVTHYDYDASGQLIATRFPDGGRVDITYDELQRQSSVTNALGTISYTYDTRDRIKKIVDHDLNEWNYTYDAAGNRTSMTALGATTTYSYDAVGQLVELRNPTGDVTTYSYDPVGQPTSVTYANGAVSSYQYDSMGRVLSLVNQDSFGIEISSYEYEYSPSGRRTSSTDGNGRTVSYTYDQLYRLAREDVVDPVVGTTSSIYSYDKVGNRISSTIGGETTLYAYDDNDRLISAGARQYSYDANGNRIGESGPDGQTNYGYNFEDRLASTNWQPSSGEEAQSYTYLYDATGTRVGKTKNGNAMESYGVDRNRILSQVVQKTNHADGSISKHDYGLGLVSSVTGSETSYFIKDGSTSVRQVLDGDGGVVHSYDYDAFGNVESSEGNAENNFLYRGHELDGETSFYHLRSRFYDPKNGVFTSTDPFSGDLQEPMSLHKYMYGLGDPVNYWDPSGRFSMPEISIVSMLTNILAGLYSLIRIFRLVRLATDLWDVGLIDSTTFANLDSAIEAVPEARLALAEKRRAAENKVEEEEEEKGCRSLPILFHYTKEYKAAKIFATGQMNTSSSFNDRGNKTRRPGAYVTDILPWEPDFTRNKLQTEIYKNPGRNVSWFVALCNDDGPKFRPDGGRQWVKEAKGSRSVPVEPLIFWENPMP